MTTKLIKTRFAPSPTGFLHVGGARTALFSWVYARKNSGKFLLRIEDTDLERSTQDAVQVILDGMEWLGLNSDAPPNYQTNSLIRYQKIIDKLLKCGKAYRCYCSRNRLDKLRETQTINKEKPRYDGHCRNLPANKDTSTKPYVIRFKNPKYGIVTWNDAIKGEINIANNELDDLIIQRSDGSPTYNFCAVIDDIDMEITHVVRGDDHVNNTPRQINLYHALNADLPIFAHVPMILGDNGKKLSKRDGAMNLMQYREDGYLPHALINYLIRLGWSHGDQEIFSMEQILKYFELSDINSSASIFNKEKLNWLNQYYISNLPSTEVSKHLKYHFMQEKININNGPKLEEIISVMAGKVKTLKELVKKSSYFYRDFNTFDEKAASKYLVKENFFILHEVKNKCKDLKESVWRSEDLLHNFLKNIASELNLNMGKIGMPVRVAITGSNQSPDIGITLKLLGRNKVMTRLQSAIAFINS